MSPINKKNDTALTLRSVTKSYDGQPVLSDLSLEFSSGTFYCLMAPSGNGIADVLGAHVLEYLCDDLCTRTLKCLRAVVLAVCSREYRNEYGRSADLMIADHNVLCLKYFVLNCFFPDIALCREYILESCVPCL